MGLWTLFTKGGWLMWPLLALGGVTIFIFVERFMAIRKASVLDMNFMNRIRDYISDGKIQTAVNLCKKTDTPIARMIEKGIERIGRPMSDVQTAIENVANLEVSKLENGLPFLATIAGGAPMIGFLGTVLGMVQTFMDMFGRGRHGGSGTAFERYVRGDGDHRDGSYRRHPGLLRLQLPCRAHREAGFPDGGQLDRIHGHSESTRSKITLIAIKHGSKVDKSFSASSMTDLMFLLLLFLLIATTLINPNALKLMPRKLQPAQGQGDDHGFDTGCGPRQSTTITSNCRRSGLDRGRGRALKTRLDGQKDATVSLHCDKTVAVGETVKVMNIAKDNNYKLILATAPELTDAVRRRQPSPKSGFMYYYDPNNRNPRRWATV